MSTVRVLRPVDAHALSGFLSTCPDTTMFLRSNAERAGLEDRGEYLQGTYVGAFADGELRAIAALYWNGNLVVEAPVDLDAVVRACAAAAPRPVRGLIGPAAQVRAAREALGMTERAVQVDNCEGLYALDLDALCVPPALAAGAVVGRRAGPADGAQLVAWRVAYEVEALGAPEQDTTRAACAETVARLIGSGDVFVVEAGGVPVAMSAFNARAPGAVQVGGVYTPPALRGRGHARAVVAASLRLAQSEGARRAVLFTDSAPAERAYVALGFRRIGDYAIVLFAA